MALTRFSLATPFLLFSFLAIASAGDYGYGPAKPDQPKLQVSEHDYKPKLKEPDYGYGPTVPLAIEGLVLCKSGSKFVPIEGAVARIVCWAEDQDGYEVTPFSCLTDSTDEKGYFFKTLPLYGLGNVQMKYKECKAYLESSPLETCKVPTDINNGITGALLSSYKILQEKKIKLYSVGPFICTSDESESAPNGHH